MEKCWKRRKCWFPAFSSFPTMFSKDFFLKVMKSQDWIVNPFPNKPWFLHVCITSLSKTWWKKKKLLVMSNFFFSHSVFYPFGELSTIFIKFEAVICKLSRFGSIYNLSFGKGLTHSHTMTPFDAPWKQGF